MIEIYHSASSGFRSCCRAVAIDLDFVIPAKAGIQALNGIARTVRDLNGYLWVADPRQVTFSCLSKRKSPKRRTPRSRRIPPALLARAGARQLVGRTIRGSTRTGARLETPARSAMLGGGYGDPKTPPCQGLRWAANPPVPRAGDRAQYARRSDPGVLSLGAGAEPPAHSCSNRARSARDICAGFESHG